MTASKSSSSQRLAWIEGIRIFAVVMILLYHAQLLFTDYAFTPQPTGIGNNLELIAAASDRLGQSPLLRTISFPIWFGFQFVDVFILISGFSLNLSLKGRALELNQFFKRRFLRILLPVWTVAWLGYPILWAIGIATKTYAPSLWQSFAGATFPPLFNFDGKLLLPASGPWWFLPLIISFTLVFPFLRYLLRRWGARNLLLVSLSLTIGYRALAVYQFGGHLTYSIVDTPGNWLPFASFMSQLSTFVLGMVIAEAYHYGKGPVFWRPRRALLLGVLIYSLGFVIQFYQLGWVVSDLLLPAGLTLCCMVVFRKLAQFHLLKFVMLGLGIHSYSYFLIHNFVIDRTIHLVIKGDLLLYYLLLPCMVLGTLILAVIADYTAPSLQRLGMVVIRDLDYVLTKSLPPRLRTWTPIVGDRVRYQGENDWKILQVEQLLDDDEFYICQVSDGHKAIWLSEHELEPNSINSQVDRNGHVKPTPSSLRP
jgi:peptidoglycan/LPS O-acetylase OafA/YrhL